MNSKGMTLIETVLAVALLGLVGLFVIQLYMSSVRTNLDSKRSLKASFIAQEAVEEFKQDVDLAEKSYGEDQSKKVDGYTVTFEKSEFKKSKNSQKVLYNILVRVSISGKEYAKLESLVSARLKEKVENAQNAENAEKDRNGESTEGGE